jgi:glycosyltransferase involved in cell wall biosynthesis
MIDVCVLLSTYNGGRYLDDQMSSIFSQVFEGTIKVLVRDDGSVDDTRAILEKWAKEFSVTVIEGNNVGPMASFFSLVGQAPHCDFYAFCDQDDVWEPHKIDSGVKRLLTLPSDQPNLYFSNAYLVDEQLANDNDLYHSTDPNFTLVGSMVCNPALGCTMVSNRSLMDIVRITNPSHTPMHDKFFLLTALLLGNVVYDKAPQIKYRQHSMNVYGREGSFKKRIKQTLRLWFGSRQSTLDKQAQEFLNLYRNRLSDLHKAELMLFAEYKKSLAKKISLLTSPNAVTTHSRANRSFMIRVLLNLA